MIKPMKNLVWMLCLVYATTNAQKTDQWQVMKNKYPDEPAVFLERSEILSIRLVGDSLQIEGESFEQILYLKEQTDAFVSRKVPGSHFVEVSNLKAKTMVWDKGKYKDLPVKDYEKKSDRDDGIFYDDSYSYSFSYPAVAEKNITQLQYTDTYRDARFIPGFIFGSYLPQEKSTFTIKAQKGVELMFEVLNDPTNTVQYKKYEKGSDVYHEWTAIDLESFKTDPDSPSIRYYMPHLVLYIKSYMSKGTRVPVLSNLDDLYKWYYSFIKDLDESTSPDLEKIVQDLKASSNSEEELVKKIFYWVQGNIRYIAFEDGMRGLIPHSGAYVCDKRYGDCKDMANLLVTMMRIAGIKSYHTWIGTRDLPYAYSKWPTPMVDNHMIATYISKQGEYFFLDATSNYTSFGLPSSMIQGKEALIGLAPDKYEVRMVPIMDKNMNVMVDSVTFEIKDNQLEGNGMASIKGYPKVFAGYRLERTNQEDVKNYVTRLVGKGSNKFYLDTYSIFGLNNQDEATSIEYKFRIGDYYQKVGQEIYINLNMNRDYYNEFINVDLRETPMENDFKYVKREVSVFAIPDGYSIEYLPENVQFDSENIGLHVTYKVLDNQVTMNKTFYIDFLMMQPEQFIRWNESVKDISDVYRESLILKKN